MKTIYYILAFIFLFACSTKKHLPEKFSARLDGYSYPYEVKIFSFSEQRQLLEMAYMDVMPLGSPKGTIVLMHGKNFSGYYFAEVIKKLSGLGYRVVVPDQIGFGKSSRPENYQYSLHGLAANTAQLLAAIGVEKFYLWGHSMGGMLATRFALMYPQRVEKLFLINPIGLEDWKIMVPYRKIHDLYQDELASTPEKIKSYQQQVYFDGQWKPEYDRLIEVPLKQLKGEDFPKLAWISALTTEMVFTQPVYYEFKNLKTPTVLVLGQRDRTAVGKNWACEEIKPQLGLYPKIGEEVAKMIPKAKLIKLDNLGHVPFIEDENRFWDSLKQENL